MVLTKNAFHVLAFMSFRISRGRSVSDAISAVRIEEYVSVAQLLSTSVTCDGLPSRFLHRSTGNTTHTDRTARVSRTKRCPVDGPPSLLTYFSQGANGLGE